MDTIRQLIIEFIKNADQQVTEKRVTRDSYDLCSKYNGQEFEGLEIRMSFGITNATHVPWIGFLGYEQEINKGINPVLLYYSRKKVLVLAYGVSEDSPPDQNWPNENQLTTVEAYFKQHHHQAPEKYGSSYVYYVYDTSTPIDAAIIERDLRNLVREYHALFKEQKSMEPKAAYTSTPSNQTSTIEDQTPYTRQQALAELFMGAGKLDRTLHALAHKKNIILQGPPGTGKTFLARRLAHLVQGNKNNARLQMIQFHQSYSYEDFIQGYRPNEEGKFDLVNGIFYHFCLRAQNDPQHPYFFIIDEINRGNLGKIFGELMMLIEHDKRGEEFAIPLTYSKTAATTFYIPANLYLIGTMNTADRSLAMVDYALRRRFSFINIVPEFENMYQYLVGKGASTSLAEKTRKRLTDLNEVIAKDPGKGFAIGHSYFCGTAAPYDEHWYRSIIENEIQPLLAEYWFDDETKVNTEVEKLLK